MRSPAPNAIRQAATAAAALIGITSAAGVEVSVTLDPPGPVAVGSTVTVKLSVSGWDAADGEVDAVAFNVDFDPLVFQFVGGSGVALADGTEFLAMANQGGAYSLSDDTDESLVAFGRFIFGATDVGDAVGGSVGPAGELGSFRLRAIAESAGSVITPQANSLSSVFFDTDFYSISPASGVTLNAVGPTTYEPMTYPKWRSGIAFGGIADALPGSDPDGDGMDNQTEYALDFDPLVADAHLLPSPQIASSGGMDYLTIVYDRPDGVLARSDLTYGGERSTDLDNWSGASVTTSISPGPPGYETVTLRSTVTAYSVPREVLRITTTL